MQAQNLMQQNHDAVARNANSFELTDDTLAGAVVSLPCDGLRHDANVTAQAVGDRYMATVEICYLLLSIPDAYATPC